jgi:type III secretory pathway component EscV
MKVFLSHSSVDKRIARRLARDLRAANVDVWLDEWEVRVGEAFAQRIEEGLGEVEFVIVLLTRASVASDWVEREWRPRVEQEAQTKRISVVPVRGEPCEIPDFLAQRSHADISGGSYPLGFKHLLAMLSHYSNAGGITYPEAAGRRPPPPDSMLPVVVPVGLEVGTDLIPLFEADGNGFSRAIDELAPAMRDALQAEFGFPFPGVQVRGNEFDMPPRSALIAIEEVPEILLEVGCDDVMVDADVAELDALGIEAEPRVDSAISPARARINIGDRAAAQAAGLTTWDAAEYLFCALQAVLRHMARLFIDIDIAKHLVDSAGATLPDSVSWFELTDVLQRLVDEEIGVGNLNSVLDALAGKPQDLTDTVMMAELARHSLRRQITGKFMRGVGSLPVFRVDREIEVLISSTILRTSSGRYLDLAPERTENILAAIREVIAAQGDHAGGIPILVTDVEVRPYVRKIVSLEFPSLHVLSAQDLVPDVPIHVAASIRLQGASA